VGDKTRAEYEDIKARWWMMAGDVESRMMIPDDGRPPYLCLTLRETCAAAKGAVASVLFRLGDVAVQDGAYLTMYVHRESVVVDIMVSTQEVHDASAPIPPSVAADVAREVLAEGADDHQCPCGEPDGVPHAHDKQGGA
jgi:hypothetical protein